MANKARAKFHRNMVLKVKRYDLDRNVAGCYPGAVEGEVIGGSLNGRMVTVTLNRTHSNERVARFHDMASLVKKSIRHPRGILLSVRSGERVMNSRPIGSTGSPVRNRNSGSMSRSRLHR